MKSEKLGKNQKSTHSTDTSDKFKNLILKIFAFILIYLGMLLFVGYVIHPFAQSRMNQFQAKVISDLVNGEELGDPLSLDYPGVQELYQLSQGTWLGIIHLSLEYRKETLAILFDQQGIPLQLRPLTSHSVGRMDRFFPQGVISSEFLPVMGYRIGRLYQQFGALRTLILQGAR